MNKSVKSLAVLVFAFVTGCFLSSVCLADGDADEREMNLDEILRLVAGENKGNKVNAFELAAAKERHAAMKSKWGPVLTADAKVLLWNGNSLLHIYDRPNFGAYPGSMLAIFEPIFNSVPTDKALRDRFTTIFGLQLVQPLTSLFQVYQGMKMAEAGVKAAEISHRDVDYGKAFEATELYLNLLYAQRAEEVVSEAIATIGEHVALAEKFESQGLIAKNAVLGARFELSKAESQLAEVREKRALAGYKLGQLLGLGTVKIVARKREIFADALQTETLEECRRKAWENRGELRKSGIAREISERREKIAYLEYVPKIALVARYENAYGLHMQPRNQVFVGLAMEWKLWDNLATHREAKAATFEALRAETKSEDVADLIALDVTQKYLAFESAKEKLKPAKSGRELAEENFRIEETRFAAGEAVSADVMTAQAKRSEAKSNELKAQIDILSAYAKLKLAMGEEPHLPEASLPETGK